MSRPDPVARARARGLVIPDVEDLPRPHPEEPAGYRPGHWTETRRIIGITGFAGSGKDTVANRLGRAFGFQRVSFADPLKEMVQLALGYPDAVLWGPSELRDETDDGGLGITARVACQRLGTEWGRALHPGIWVAAWKRYVRRNPRAHIVTADVRFPNELEAVKRAGGVVWQVIRPGVGPCNEHESEHALRDVPTEAYDAVLNNSGTVDELHEKVRELLEAGW